MRSAQSRDISIVWTSFLMKIIGLWLAGDQVEQRRRNFALIYTINAVFIATCIAIRDIYYSWGNFSDCIYISCNISYLMIVALKVAVLYSHKTEFYDLIRFAQKNFWHSNYDSEEKLVLADCKRLCAIFIIAISFCAQGTCAGYMVTPILANIGRNQSERALPFNMWIDFPTGMSPYFEVLFSIQILCVYHVGISCICFDNFLCIVNLHIASQFRILQYRLISLNKETKNRIVNAQSNTNLYACIIYKKFKSCVQHHQVLTECCKKVEDIFTLIILGHVMFLTLLLCLVGYQLFLTDTPPSRGISLVLNLLGALCQLFIFTYSCDGLIHQSVNVGKAMFSVPWTALLMDKTGKTIRQDLIIVIMRTHRSCCLTASGFFPVSLETYTGVVSTAMSYFTLLKQSSEDMVNA